MREALKHDIKEDGQPREDQEPQGDIIRHLHLRPGGSNLLVEDDEGELDEPQGSNVERRPGDDHLHHAHEPVEGDVGLGLSEAQGPHVVLDDEVTDETAAREAQEVVLDEERGQALPPRDQAGDEEAYGHDGADVP